MDKDKLIKAINVLIKLQKNNQNIQKSIISVPWDIVERVNELNSRIDKMDIFMIDSFRDESTNHKVKRWVKKQIAEVFGE